MFYWCQKHKMVEPDSDKCGAMDRLGPYPTPRAAENWRETASARNEAWEEEDERWEGED